MAKQDEVIEESSHPFNDFEIGDQVKHPKWGVGTILFRSGKGDASKVIVVFPEEGQKKLALKYAKLKKVSDTKTKAPKEEKPPKDEDADKEESEEIEDIDEEIEDDDDQDDTLPPAEGEEISFGDDEDEDFSKLDDDDDKDD